MKKKKYTCIALAAVLSVAAYVSRFQYMNRQFPKENVTVVEEGQTIEYNGIEHQIVSGELLTGREYIERYTDDHNFGKEDVLFLVWMEFENQTDSEKQTRVGDLVVDCGIWANGIDYYALWTVNGADFDGVLKAHEKKKIGIITMLTTDLKTIQSYHAPWRVRLGNWPDRIELVVPVEQERV